jgi:hypothetical protein
MNRAFIDILAETLARRFAEREARNRRLRAAGNTTPAGEDCAEVWRDDKRIEGDGHDEFMWRDGLSYFEEEE